LNIDNYLWLSLDSDKLGAAGLAGFVLTTAILKPKGIRVVAELGMVRNSVGSNGYVSDEVIVSHAGVRVKVGNSDAEGRMVLSDCVSHLRVIALQSVNPIIMTCATLTGHGAISVIAFVRCFDHSRKFASLSMDDAFVSSAMRAVGNYSITLDNGPAFREGYSRKLQEVSELWGEPFEVSVLRKDDFEFVKPKNSDYDVLQCNTQPSSMTARGHQVHSCYGCYVNNSI
jgi:leucyl aminopeptidase